MLNKIHYLIADTNIIQFLGNKPQNRSDLITTLVLEKEQAGLIKAISVSTVYEAIQNCNLVKETAVLYTLEKFVQLEANEEIFKMAGRLSDIYRKNNIPDSQISTCDKLIAASAILYESHIITADGNDYPRPFFNEVEKRNILYQTKDGKDALLTIYVLQPDLEIINDRLVKRQQN